MLMCFPFLPQKPYIEELFTCSFLTVIFSEFSVMNKLISIANPNRTFCFSAVWQHILTAFLFAGIYC